MSERARLTWADYFMSIAHAAALRSTCDRKRVGCLLVVDNRIVATGYNGSAPGSEHCDDVGHDLVESMGSDGVLAPNCVRTTHAEANAVAQAARFGTATRNAVAYVNTFPCWGCFKLLLGAGITRVVYDDMYREDRRVHDAALVAGVSLDAYLRAP